MRPSYEDLLGAGAIAAALPGSRSPEVAAAVAVFEAAFATEPARLRDAPLSWSSGRELVERGFSGDVLAAAELYVETTAPELIDGCFVPAP